ncbi:MAG: PKD domain-containing protein, partial [Ginsengibacter sp.]
MKHFLVPLLFFISPVIYAQTANIGGIINDYTPIKSYNPCNNSLNVVDASRFKIGDTVLIIQMKGAIIDTTNTPNFGKINDYKEAGNYDYNFVSGKVGNAILLKLKLERNYNYTIGKVQLIRVPFYNDAIIQSTLSCLPWDGDIGGVLAFFVKNKLILNSDIVASGKGFRPGTPLNSEIVTLNEQGYFYDPTSNNGGEKGEGIQNISIDKNYGRGSPSNGGGGGNAHNSGGGGGGNGGIGGDGGDQWAPGKTITENVGGKGGKLLVTNGNINKIFLGGSGGMGQANNQREFLSGAGGGIILITASSLNNNNFKIISNGNDAQGAPNSAECKDGMAGGGAGGSIVLDIANVLNPVAVEAKGGKGADHIAQNVLHGPGGGGGGGMVMTSNSIFSTNYSINISGGINGVNVYHNNDPYGATSGSAGVQYSNFKLLIDSVPFKKNIDSVILRDTALNCYLIALGGFAYTNSKPIVSWKWDFGDGTINYAQRVTAHLFPQSGNYLVKLIVTDSDGCIDSISKLITVKGINITKSPDTSICKGNSVKIFASGGSMYQWTPATSLDDSAISNPLATPSVTTKYYVQVSESAVCSKKDSITITVKPLPVISTSNDTTICTGTSINLLAIGGNSYSWSPSNSLNNPNINNPVATPKTSTTYFVVSKGINGCSKEDSIKIVIHTKPNISITNDTSICKNSSIQLNVSGGSTYAWSPSNTLSNPNIKNPIASPTSTTNYLVKVTDKFTCKYNDSVLISIRPKNNFSISPDTSVCSKQSLQLLASGGDQYLWSPSSYLNNQNIGNPIATVDTTITYTVLIIDNVCKDSAILSSKIMALPLPFISASKSNDITCSAPFSQLSATGGKNYSWSPAATLDNPTISSPKASPSATTLYLVTGTAENGCKSFDTISIKVFFTLNRNFDIPNAFTPNNDGLNDCFGVKYLGDIKDFNFSIYNRYGQRVFHTNDPS